MKKVVKNPNSNVTGSKNSDQPASLVGSSFTNIGAEMSERVVKTERIVRELLDQITLLNERIEFLEREIAIPYEFKFESLGTCNLTFKKKFNFYDTGLSSWKNHKLIYISFGKRVPTGNSYGGGAFILSNKLLDLEPSRPDTNAGSNEAASISIGSQALQATYINAQVNIGRSDDDTLLVAANNTNSGATPLKIYSVSIGKVQVDSDQ